MYSLNLLVAIASSYVTDRYIIGTQLISGEQFIIPFP